MPDLDRLRATFPRAGALVWIAARPRKNGDLKIITEARLDPDTGLEYDRCATGKRQITLIQAEHLPVIAELCGLDRVDPRQLRRNLVVSGISVWALKDRKFTVGPVTLGGTGACHPCSRMETALGVGGYNAMRGHGGITAHVLTAGRIQVGDAVSVIRSSA
ncbi:MAG: MOSC domain-containing protein [Gammaproteobacteria bacterium]|nr:MOSC domain-containing protein [Gammaproteobacteria bacterium]